jgi:hypothetical protein
MKSNCFIPLDYESRNLGMPAFALQDNFIAASDESLLKNSITGLAEEHKNFFAQARVEKDCFNIIPLLGRCGFMYIETAITPFTILTKNPVLQTFLADRKVFLPKRYNCEDITLTTLTEVDTSRAAEVRLIASESFVDDRFHLDPYCSKDLADGRYAYWVDDLMRSDAIFQLLKLRDELVGFMIRQKDRLVLAGFSRKYAASGLGDYLWLSVLASMLDEGLASTITQISVNNTNVLNLYARLAFKFKSPAALFHLWR